MKRRFRGLVWSLVSVPAYVVTTRAKAAETEPVPPPLAGLSPIHSSRKNALGTPLVMLDIFYVTMLMISENSNQ